MKKTILILMIIVTYLNVSAQNLDLNNNTDYIRVQKNGETDFSRAFGLNSANKLYIGSVEKTISDIIFFNKGTNVLMSLSPTGTLNVTNAILNKSFRLGNNDFAMRRNSAGDTTWRRALVPGYTSGSGFSRLYMNYGGDFDDVRIMGGKTIIDGNLGIGTENPDSKLTVKGKIHCEEVKVDLSVPADYVFQKYYNGISTLKADYTMPTLEEVEAYTKANHHLPEIPSAKEIKENGLKLKEMTNLLLQKIEELTLYTIEQEKRINALESKLTSKE